MASQIGSLFFSLSVDTSGVASGVGRAARTTERGMGRITRSAGLAEASIRRTNRSLARPLRPFSLIAASRAFDSTGARAQLLRGSMIALTGAFGGFSAALGTNVLLRYADSFTELRNQIRVVARDSGDLAAQFAAVEAVSIRSRAGLRETAILYSRLRKSAPTQSAQQILEFTETIQKSLQLGGATAQEAASAAIQFSQAIASNRLGGEELRAVLETPLGLELAKGLGITIGRFRELGKAGELTAEVLFGALEKQGPSVARQFNQSIRTFDQAVTIADTNLTSYVGKLNESVGATQILGNSVIGLTSNLEQLAPILGSIVGVLGAAFGGRLISSPINRAGDAVSALRTNAKSELNAAKQVVQASKAENLASRNSLAALLRASRSGQGVDFADVELGKAAEQASARANQQLPKLDTKKLGLLEQEGRLRRDLARITANLTPAQIRSSEILGREQAKLNAALASERLIRRQITASVTAQTGALGLQATTGVGGAAAAAAVREQTRLTKELGRVQTTITSLTEKSTARRIALNEAETASYNRAVTARAGILTKLGSVTGKLARVDSQRDALTSASRTARAGAAAQGSKNLTGQIGRGALIVGQTGAGLDRAEKGLRAATKAAKPLGVAIRGVRSAFGGLVGFLGGPFGFAITAAIIGFSALGFQSAKTAAQIERSRRVIGKTLESLRKEGGLGSEQADETLQELRIIETIKEARKDLDANRAGLKNSLNEIEDIIKVSGQRLSGESARAPIGKATVKQIKELSEAAAQASEAGAVPKFVAQVRELAQARGLDDEATRRVIEFGFEALATAQSVIALKKAIDEAGNSSRANDGIVVDTRLDDAAAFLRSSAPALTKAGRETATERDKLFKIFKTEGVQVNSAVEALVKLQAQINSGLRRSSREVRSSVREFEAIQSDTLNFVRSLSGRGPEEISIFGDLEAERRRIRDLTGEVERARDALGGLERLGGLFTGVDARSAQVSGITAEVAELFDLARAAEAGRIKGAELAAEFDRVRRSLRSLSGNDTGIERLIDQVSQWIVKLSQANEQLRIANSNVRRLGQSGSLQVTSRTVPSATGGSSRPVEVRVTKGSVIETEDQGVLSGVRDSVDSLDRLDGTVGENVSATRGVDASVKNLGNQLVSSFEQQFSSLRASSGFSDFEGQFEFQDAETQAAAKRVAELEREREILQAGLQFKDLSPEQREDSEQRIAEIGLIIAKLADALAKLPAPTFGQSLSGGLSLDLTRRGINSEQRINFDDLLGTSSALGFPGFARGGTFDVGGSGGTDSKLVQFRATPTETVTVLKRGEHQALLNAVGAGSGATRGGAEVTVNMHLHDVQDRDSFAVAREQVAVDTASSIQQALAG